jgi:hypothetical protein
VSIVIKFAELLNPHSCSRSNSIIHDMEFLLFVLHCRLQFKSLGKMAAIEVRYVWTSAEAASVATSEHRLLEGHFA